MEHIKETAQPGSQWCGGVIVTGQARGCFEGWEEMGRGKGREFARSDVGSESCPQFLLAKHFVATWCNGGTGAQRGCCRCCCSALRTATGDEEVAGVAHLQGIILQQDIPHLSHLGVRSRQVFSASHLLLPHLRSAHKSHSSFISWNASPPPVLCLGNFPLRLAMACPMHFPYLPFILVQGAQETVPQSLCFK